MFYKNLIRYHMHKIIYIFLICIVLTGYFSYERDVIKDRENIKAQTTITATFEVVSIPVIQSGKTTFFAEAKHGMDVYCNVYVICDKIPSLRLSDTITIKGTPLIPEAPLNSFGYSMGNYLKTKGASIIFSAENGSTPEIVDGLFNPIYNIRQKVSEKLFDEFLDSDAQLINALLTGDKTTLSEERAETYRRAGVYHMVAVSGLHVGILLMFLSLLWLPFRPRNFAGKTVRLFVTLLGGIFILTFTGFGMSVQRAAFMSVIMCMAPLLGRNYSPFAAINAILLLLALYEPYCITDLSLQLSFAATYGILTGVKLTENIHFKKSGFNSLFSAIIITLSSTVATAPFLIFQFGKISVVGIISNLVVLLPVAPLMILSYIFAILCPFAPKEICSLLCYFMTPMAQTINILSDFFASFSWAYISLKPYHLVLIVGEITLFELYKLAESRKIKYSFAALFIVANIGFLSYNTLHKETDICFMNAGCGECTLITSSDNMTFMIDCGSSTDSGFASNEVIPGLEEKSINKIDVLFLTGFSQERANGVTILAENGYLKEVIIPDVPPKSYERELLNEILKACLNNNVNVKRVENDSVINFGNNHKFKIIYPEHKPEQPVNNAMICYSYMDKKVLFCSEIKNEKLDEMIDDLTQCDIVKLPSGGSYNSKTKELLDVTKAKYVVLSDIGKGKDIRVSTATIAMIDKEKLYRTDTTQDAVDFTLTKNEILCP